MSSKLEQCVLWPSGSWRTLIHPSGPPAQPPPVCPVFSPEAWGSHQGYVLASDIMLVLHFLQRCQVLALKISHRVSSSHVSCRDRGNQQQKRGLPVRTANSTHFRAVSSIHPCSAYSQQSSVQTTLNQRHFSSTSWFVTSLTEHCETLLRPCPFCYYLDHCCCLHPLVRSVF